MGRLWTTDVDGEKWLVNPQLIIANPRRKRRAKKMARRKGRMPAGLARYWAKKRRGGTKRRRRAKSNFASAGMLANPRRRRRSRGRGRRYSPAMRRLTGRAYGHNPRRHRRHARRNPQLLGFQLPQLQDVVFTGAGFIVPPMLTSYIMTLIPDSYKTNQAVVWGVKAASVLVPSLAVRKFVSQRAGNLMLLGGAVSFTIDLIKTFAPGMIPGLGAQPFLGYYNTMPQPRALGKYQTGNRLGGLPAMISATPERLMPTNRF
jgi:hypothetical protein